MQAAKLRQSKGEVARQRRRREPHTACSDVCSQGPSLGCRPGQGSVKEKARPHVATFSVGDGGRLFSRRRQQWQYCGQERTHARQQPHRQLSRVRIARVGRDALRRWPLANSTNSTRLPRSASGSQTKFQRVRGRQWLRISGPHVRADGGALNAR